MPKDRAKGLILQLRGFDAQHYARTERYAKQIEQLFATATTEFANAAQGALFQPTEVFSFDDYPKTRQQAQRILTDLTRKVEAVITSGVKTEWLAATYKNDAFLGSILRTSQLTKEEAEQYQDRNLEALRAFQGRKIRGEMRLSGAVWNYTTNFINDVELSIDAALGEGTSAADLARKVRQNLKDPEAIYRRFRVKEGEDENGNPIWGRKWKRRQYDPETGKTTWIDDDPRKHHPGQGVYRSAVKNAQRLTRTEINMAYRESEYLRWQQLDFVVGIRIALSNNHTIVNPKTGKREPFTDICDELAGDYPKTFKFLGWHPQCRCVVTPIMKDYDEFNRDRANRFKAIVRKEQYKALPSRRTVTDVPANFRDYIDSIADRAKGWKSQPYYIRDNFKGGKIAGGLKVEVPTKTMNAVEPCREFDAEIDKYNRWAYALGLDTSQIEPLRTAGNKAGLRLELDRLNREATERQLKWGVAYNDFKRLQTNGEVQQFPELAKWIEQTAQENEPTTGHYYADCTSRLQAALSTFLTKLADLKAKAAAALATSGDKPHKALLRTYTTDAEVDTTFTTINGEMKTRRWFENGDLKLTPTTKNGVNGFTYMDGRISLTPERLKAVKSALGKIAKGDSASITFDEADAMATFWHEITHNRNVPGNIPLTTKQTKCMELANEFVARKTLPEFYGKLGAAATPHPEFMTNRATTGYNRMVKAYDRITTHLGLDAAKVLDAVRKNLYEEVYTDQKTGLIKGLIEGGIKTADEKKPTQTAVGRLVETCIGLRKSYASDAEIEKIILTSLKANGFIK